MTNYKICPFCEEPIKVEIFGEHFEKHGKKKETDLVLRTKIFEDAEQSLKSKGADDGLSFDFEVAKRVFSEIEKIDTSDYNYILDSEYPDLMSRATVSVPSPYSPIMCTFRYKIRDKKLFEKVLKKYEGTPKEQVLKGMVSDHTKTIMVFQSEYVRSLLEWKSKGMTNSDIMVITTFFFLHEMYHIIGYGERDSDIKASNAIFKIFGQLVSIPEHEITRWKYEEEKGFV
ncbi:MAG TPA: hypothetical protein VK487_06375 [Candidatus Bathyarchaeia archaeon]|nr:hypothetical protein [Candidatus Bathyarchaeia archaeon]